MDLASALLGDQATQSQNLQLRQGVVTQASPLLVKVGAATTAQPCNALAEYAPNVGDTVSVLVIDGDRLVLGRSSAGTAWTPVTFTGSWVNYGAPYQLAQYRKVGDEVQIRGLIKSGVTNTAAFTLPAGFRPPATMEFVSSGPSGIAFAQAVVDASGVVLVQSATGTSDVALNIRFSTSA